MERWKFKKWLKTICKVSCAYGLLTLLVALITVIKFETNWKFIVICICWNVLVTLVPVFGLVIIYWLTNVFKKDIDDEGYYREIDNMYAPAMLSYLLDNFLEKKQDISATILNLSIKKFLIIKKNNNKFEISVNEQELERNLNEEKFKSLYQHEIYIIKTLKNHKKIDINEFCEQVIYDCEKNELIYRNTNPIIRFLLISKKTIEFICIMGLAIGGATRIIFILPHLGIVFLIGILLAYIGKFALKSHKRTSKGLEIATKAKQLKKYFRDYTLLKEKDYDHIETLERYIPYALALGEANTIEKLYLENENFTKEILENFDFIAETISKY